MSISADPIVVVQTTNNFQERLQRRVEEAGQTFVLGTPVEIASDGGVKAWDGATLTGVLLGISSEDAHNFASLGPNAPGPLQPYLGPGGTLTFGSVPNEASAVNLARGAPFVDGRLGYYVGRTETNFRAIFGNNGSLATPTVANVGKQYGLTIDSNSKYWYVDANKTSSNAVVEVVALDPIDGSISGAHVWFSFLPAAVVLT